ncbi:hypothetical protein HDU98_003959, partial [Podochytrium sp. JEL0797]
MLQLPQFDFKGKNVFISGGSRGIGLEIARKLAKLGANVAIAAKTAEPHPKLPGTIYTAADSITSAGGGGRGLPLICDIRFEAQVYAAVAQTVATFGGIDILINNASAISLTSITSTSLKTFDLMNQINGRGTYLCTLACLPHLQESARKGRNPHVLTLSPPLDMRPFWFENHTAYSMAKYAMSLCTLGLSGDLRQFGIAVNSLWPLTAIDTSAMNVILDNAQEITKYRNADIMADAAALILCQDARAYTGNFVIDEAILRTVGVTDFSGYKLDKKCPDNELVPDFFVPEDIYAQAPGAVVARGFVCETVKGLKGSNVPLNTALIAAASLGAARDAVDFSGRIKDIPRPLVRVGAKRKVAVLGAVSVVPNEDAAEQAVAEDAIADDAAVRFFGTDDASRLARLARLLAEARDLEKTVLALKRKDDLVEAARNKAAADAATERERKRKEKLMDAWLHMDSSEDEDDKEVEEVREVAGKMRGLIERRKVESGLVEGMQSAAALGGGGYIANARRSVLGRKDEMGKLQQRYSHLSVKALAAASSSSVQMDSEVVEYARQTRLTDTEKRVEHLYTRVGALDGCVSDVGYLVARLHALEGVHAAANGLSERVGAVVAAQMRTVDGVRGLEALVREVEKGVEANRVAVDRNWGVLESRADDMIERFLGLNNAAPRGFAVDGAALCTSGAWTVFRATRTGSSERLALFVAAKGDPAMAALLMRDATTLSRLRHPSLMEVKDPAKESAKQVSFAAEPLLSCLASLPPLDDIDIQRGLLQLIKGLHFLHSHGWTHANLCPDAVFVNEKSDWKLACFAFAQSETSASRDSSFYLSNYPPQCSPRLDFLAPEAVLESKCGPASDIWSLGCLIYALFNRGVSPVHTNDNLHSYRSRMGRGEIDLDLKNVPASLH